MNAVALGLIAALAWGIHDVCVRYVSQRAGIIPAMSTVLLTGSLLALPVALAVGDWNAMTAEAFRLSILSGIAFAAGGLGLYKSFEIGPVKLVAPVVGAYPVLSVGWPAIAGTPVTVDQWLAVLVVVLGVGMVSTLSSTAESAGRRQHALGWALISAAGFAASFALGQAGGRLGAELPVLMITRAAALACVIAFALAWRTGLLPGRRQLPLLIAMGALDALALGAVMSAAPLPHPEYAAVGASSFGIFTIILARFLLRETMTPGQWCGVLIAFSGIAYLGA